MDINHATNRSSPMSRRPHYDVFLSFRGPETREDFAYCLHTRLTDAGIRVCRDEEELEIGEEIISQLLQAIKQSKISIPIISKGYGESKSCLMELEQMWKCKQNEGHIIIPIFYYVDPSDVRYGTGPFRNPLRGHKRNNDGEVINNWKSALRGVGKLKGYPLDKNSKEPQIIKEIVNEVLYKLKKEDLIVTKQLVGVDPHVQDIMDKLKVGCRNGQAGEIVPACEMVLIHGIPGVGKTTLAKHVYNKLHDQFDACSFLGNIRAKVEPDDILSLQNKLITDLHKGRGQMKFDCSDKAMTHIGNRFKTMKVLLLLDDVRDGQQLSALFGKLDWLGRGSRVILTSQSQDVLRNITGAQNFGLGLLKEQEALTLFCRHAFGTDSPPKEFETLSKEIVAATGGLAGSGKFTGGQTFNSNKKR